MNNSLKSVIRRFLPTTPRPHRILAGPLRGATIFTSWHDYPGAILGTTEQPLLDWFHRHVAPGETWLDVGAHYGYTALALCRLVGTSGRVFAFEPVLSTAGCVARTRELNRLSQLRIVPLALGSSPEPVTTHLPLVRGMADSTIARGVWEEPISAVAFDSVWPLMCQGDPRVDGVKIDVQGMEIAVLEGMRGALLRHRPKLIVEFHKGVDRRRALQLLESCGYDPDGQPVESAADSPEPFADDKSYVFRVIHPAMQATGSPR